MHDKKIEEYLARFSLGQNMDVGASLHDWKVVASDGLEDMIVSAYISELGSGTITSIATMSISNSADASEVAMFDSNLVGSSRTEINSIASGFISNLVSAGYYGLLFKRFITFATACEDLRGDDSEKVTENTLVKAFSQWIMISVFNHIIVKNQKHIQAQIAKLQRESSTNAN